MSSLNLKKGVLIREKDIEKGKEETDNINEDQPKNLISYQQLKGISAAIFYGFF